jgi:N-acyl-D-amino-acid deacylase
MKLVQEGKLKLNDRAFTILKNPKPCRSGPIDKRIYEITIAELLNMSAGWDREISGDPGFKSFSYAAAETCGGKVPADPLTVIRFCMGRPLDFNPGTRYAYSNLAYTTLGQIVEQVSGVPYLQYINNEVLKPIGTTSIMPGGTLLSQRKPNEVIYYDKPGSALATPIYPELKELTPNCYGGNFALEAMLAAGGFISTAQDLVRLGSAISGEREGPIDLATFQLMASRAPLVQSKDTDKNHYYGLGYDIYLVRDGKAFNWNKDGALCGTRALLAHRCDHITWAFVCNTRNKEDDFLKEMAECIWDGVNGVRNFPDYDLFDRYK